MGPGTIMMIVKLLEVMSLGLTVGPQIAGQIKGNLSKLRTMVEEGRDPTPEEWAEIDKDIESLRSALHKPI